MTDEELKKLRDQARDLVGSNAIVLAALINAKAIRDATHLIADKLEVIAIKMEQM